MKDKFARALSLLFLALAFNCASAQKNQELQPDSLIFDIDNYDPSYHVADNEFVYEYSAAISNATNDSLQEVVRFKIVDDGWLIDYGDYVHNYFPFWTVLSFETRDENGLWSHSSNHYAAPVRPNMNIRIRLRSVNKNDIPDVMWEKSFAFDDKGFLARYEILYFQEDGVHYGEQTCRSQEPNGLKVMFSKLIGKSWYKVRETDYVYDSKGRTIHQEIREVDMTTDQLMTVCKMDATYDRKGRTTGIVTYHNTDGVMQGGSLRYEDYGSNALTDKFWSRSEMRYSWGNKRTTIEFSWEDGKWCKRNKYVARLSQSGEVLSEVHYVFENGKWVKQ